MFQTEFQITASIEFDCLMTETTLFNELTPKRFVSICFTAYFLVLVLVKAQNNYRQ